VNTAATFATESRGGLDATAGRKTLPGIVASEMHSADQNYLCWWQHTFMSMKRTTVFADEDDLAVIKAAATRRGIAEAEIIRDAIHLAALANRNWDEPFFRTSFSSGGSGGVGVAGQVWAERAVPHQRDSHPGSP
jgi:hypothetical protein